MDGGERGIRCGNGSARHPSAFLEASVVRERARMAAHTNRTPSKRRFRQTRYSPATPYIEVSLKKPDRMNLHEVVIGRRAPGIDVARGILDQYGYNHVPVSESQVPYRLGAFNWLQAGIVRGRRPPPANVPKQPHADCIPGGPPTHA